MYYTSHTAYCILYSIQSKLNIIYYALYTTKNNHERPQG